MSYACDLRWWRVHHSFNPCPDRWTRDLEASLKYGLSYIESKNLPGLSVDPKIIHEGGNSGYQALNLVYHMGAKEIALLGFDMGATGTSHFFGDHPGSLQVKHPPFTQWIKQFQALATDLESAGVSVINYTRETALQCFKRGHLDSL